MFRDQSGNVDVERLVDFQPGQFLTKGVASSRTGVGSLWQYKPVSADVIQVKNLTSGVSFTLRRCPVASVGNGVGAVQQLAGANQRDGGAPPAVTQTGASVPGTLGAGPSFDCQKARDPVSATICSDPGLRRIDLTFNQAYQAYRQQLIEEQRPLLRQDASSFGKSVIQTCQLPNSGIPDAATMVRAVPCLARAYEAKRAEYLSRLTPEATQEATRDIHAHLALQARLVETGMLASSATVDGVYGPIVRDAVTRVQAQHGLPQTGLMSDATSAFVAKSVAELQSNSATVAAANPDSRGLNNTLDRLRDMRAQTEAPRAANSRPRSSDDNWTIRHEAEIVENEARIKREKAVAEVERQRGTEVEARQSAANQQATERDRAEAKVHPEPSLPRAPVLGPAGSGSGNLMAVSGKCLQYSIPLFPNLSDPCNHEIYMWRFAQSNFAITFSVNIRGSKMAGVIITFSGDLNRQIQAGEELAMPVDTLGVEFNSGVRKIFSANGRCWYSNPTARRSTMDRCSVKTEDGEFFLLFQTDGSDPQILSYR